jgi:hypothetical protein
MVWPVSSVSSKSPFAPVFSPRTRAGLVSVFDAAEYVMYLIADGLIVADDARRLVPEDALIEQIAKAHPLLVDRPAVQASKLIYGVYPALANFLKTHYRPAYRAGGYQVLEWKD